MAERQLRLGLRVELLGKDMKGTIAFIGVTDFAAGKWVGIVLDDSKGKNNGTVMGKSYFECVDNHGIFVRASQLAVLDDSGNEGSTDNPMSASTGAIPAAEEKAKMRSSLRRPTRPTGPPKSRQVARSTSFPSSMKRRVEPTRRRTPQTSSSKPEGLRLPVLSRSTPASMSRSSLNLSSYWTPQGSLSPFNSRASPLPAGYRLPVAGNKTPTDNSGKDESTSKETTPRETPRSEGGSKRASFVETGFVETLKAQYTPGTSMSASMASSLDEKMNHLHQIQEIETLRAQVKDLEEKLETLRVKRAQDKEKLKDHDKMRLQMEQLAEFKMKVLESQAQLQRDVQKAKQEAREAIEAKERHADEMSDLAETVEMATLDKEMAEEKAETFQLELEQAKEKIEELTLDLEILQAEISTKGMDGAASSFQLKQLEQQNNRLKETLLRMRDLSAQDKHELQKLSKESEQQTQQLEEIQRSREKLLRKVEESESAMRELQEQVDAALGAEEMVEQLTSRNLNLEEKLAELEEMVLDLEALHETDEELQEGWRELELELREELDMAQARTREAHRERDAALETLMDSQQTVIKFRELVHGLQEQNRDLRKTLEKESASSSMVTSPEGSLATSSEMMDFQKVFSQSKAHTTAMDLELRRMEVQQAQRHVQLLIAYMPASFSSRGGDQEAVLALLMLPRLLSKADVLLQQAREKFVPAEVQGRESLLKDHLVERHAFGLRLTHLLLTLQAVIQRYESVMGCCSTELFLRLGTLYGELAVQEKTLDAYVELVRKDQLDENVSLDAIDKVCSYFVQLFNLHLSAEEESIWGSDGRGLGSSFLLHHFKALAAGGESFRVEVKRIQALLQMKKEGGEGKGEGEIESLLEGMLDSAQEMEKAAKRARRRLTQDVPGIAGLTLTPQRREQIEKCLLLSSKVIKAMHQISRLTIQQVTLLTDAEAVVPEAKVRELILLGTDGIFGKEGADPLEDLKESISEVLKSVEEVSQALADGQLEFFGGSGKSDEKSDTPKQVSPVLRRAEEVKRELEETSLLRRRLEDKEAELREIRRVAKSKGEELSQMQLRRDVAEKRLAQATKDSELAIERLQRRLEDAQALLRQKEKEFEDTMDHLQSDIDSLESERGELKEKLKAFSKKALLEGLAARSSSAVGTASVTVPLPSSTPTLPAPVTTPTLSVPASPLKDSPMLLHHLHNMKSAIHHLRDENLQLKASRVRDILTQLPPLKLPKKSIGVSSSMQDTYSKGEISELSKRTSNILNELNKMARGPLIIDLTKKKPGTQPILEKSSPEFQILEEASKLERLKSDAQELQSAVARLVSSRKPGGYVSTQLTTFPTPLFTKAMQESDAVLVGRVWVPTPKGEEDKIIPVILSQDAFRDIHLKLCP